MSQKRVENIIDSLITSIDSMEQKENSATFSDVQQFLQETEPPSNIKQIQQDVIQFVAMHASSNRNFVFITSGGTTVPLELNTVRFIDNFSTGTRGAASCEYFLKHNCNVILLHRRGSICPFIRHIQYKTSKYFDIKFFQTLTLNENNINIETKTDDTNDIKQSFKLYDAFVHKQQ
eukprot:492355_1